MKAKRKYKPPKEYLETKAIIKPDPEPMKSTREGNYDIDSNGDFYAYMNKAKKERRDKRVASSLAFFKKEGIPYELTNVPNLVRIRYDWEWYKFSLPTSKVLTDQGWIKITRAILKQHKKVSLSEAINKKPVLLRFGKYVGCDIKKMISKEEISYLKWLGSQDWLDNDLRLVIFRHLENVNFNNIVKAEQKKLFEVLVN